METQQLRIGIDARPLYWTGIGRYIEETLLHLSRIDLQNEYFIYYHESLPKSRVGRAYWHPELRGKIETRNFRFVVCHVPVCSVREQIALPTMLRRDGIALFHSPYINVPLLAKCHRIVTIHDIHLRNYMRSTKRAYYEFMTRRALVSAQRIIVVSQSLRDEVRRFMPACAEKIAVIHHGVSAAFHPVTNALELADMKRAHHIRGEYFLFVGTFLAHKNLPVLIRAFHRVRKSLSEPCQLVIAAKVDERFSEPLRLVRGLGLSDDVLFVGHVAKETLPALYSGAKALVVPSLYESFGLPVIEAMSCGTPVIASSLWALPEVAGEAALLIDPHSELQLIEAMLRIYRDPILRACLREQGLRRAKEFSWLHAAKQLRQVYEACA